MPEIETAAPGIDVEALRVNKAVLAIGCDSYDHMPALQGAAHDATRVFELLRVSKLYESSRSALLLSPSLSEVRSALDSLASQPGLEVITFFFAGHGGSKAGNYYLCLRDSRADRLSTTGLPIVDLFGVAGEIRPKQVNFVIDACHAAAVMFDLHALLKPEIIGPARSSSIAFLAASASDQYAGEVADGGIATSALVRYLDGTRQVQSDRPYLDLVEVGSAVARDVRRTNPTQDPVAWGLNLYGDGIFAANPHYAGDSAVPHSALGIVPTSEIGRRLQGMSEKLWEEYRLVASESDPQRLYQTLSEVRLALGADYSRFLRGFSPALAARGSESIDLFAASDAIGTCLASLLPNTAPADLESMSALLEEREAADLSALDELLARLARNRHSLFGDTNALADFHYLPVRVSQILSWVSLLRCSHALRGAPRQSVVDATNELVSHVFGTYSDCLVALTDDQAPWVHIFSTLAPTMGWLHYAWELLDRMFQSALPIGGRVLRHGADGSVACRFSLARAGLIPTLDGRALANPGDLLATVLLCGSKLGLSDRWDPMLVQFDGLTLNMYVPDHYTSFGDPHIPRGNNFLSRVGHDFWASGELAAFFESNVKPHVLTARAGLSPEQELTCAIAGHLFPNRVPYLLGAIRSLSASR